MSEISFMTAQEAVELLGPDNSLVKSRNNTGSVPTLDPKEVYTFGAVVSKDYEIKTVTPPKSGKYLAIQLMNSKGIKIADIASGQLLGQPVLLNEKGEPVIVKGSSGRAYLQKADFQKVTGDLLQWLLSLQGKAVRLSVENVSVQILFPEKGMKVEDANKFLEENIKSLTKVKKMVKVL